jgi:hypothetical protein
MFHISANSLQKVGFFAIEEHIDGFAKGEVAHHIESIIIEPLSYINWPIKACVNCLNKLLSIFGNT